MPRKSKDHMNTLKPVSMSLAIRLVLFYLLIAEGIESNPGPGSGSGSRGAPLREVAAKGVVAHGGETLLICLLKLLPVACRAITSEIIHRILYDLVLHISNLSALGLCTPSPNTTERFRPDRFNDCPKRYGSSERKF